MLFRGLVNLQVYVSLTPCTYFCLSHHWLFPVLCCYNFLTIPLVRLFLTRQHSHKHSRYIHKHGNNRNMYTGTQAQTQLLQVPSLFHMSCLPYPSSHFDCSCPEVWGRSCTLHCVSILQYLCWEDKCGWPLREQFLAFLMGFGILSSVKRVDKIM